MYMLSPILYVKLEMCTASNKEVQERMSVLIYAFYHCPLYLSVF